MTLVAISTDELADSREFARAYGIEYPLVSDVGGAISRQLVGIDDNDITIPGVVVIRRDGAIVFRQIATSKDDRLTARELLDAVDRSLGTTGSTTSSWKPALARIQLRADIGGARTRVAGDWHSAIAGRATISVPLTRYLVAGTGLGLENTEASLVSSLGVRLPLLHDIAAIQLMADAALPLFRAPGVYAGLRGGLWYATSPGAAFQLDVAFGARDAGAADQQPGFAVTFGTAFLFP